LLQSTAIEFGEKDPRQLLNDDNVSHWTRTKLLPPCR
jgi:hypothetical protein